MAGATSRFDGRFVRSHKVAKEQRRHLLRMVPVSRRGRHERPRWIGTLAGLHRLLHPRIREPEPHSLADLPSLLARTR